MKSLVRLCAATLCVVPFTGCGGGNSVSQPPPSSVNVTLTPGSTSLLVKTSTTFAATVTGHSNTAVTYSVMEGTAGGNILSNGVYTAPAKPGAYTVRATSVADPSRHADATVSVHDYKHTIALSAKTIDGYDYHTASLLPDGSILIVGGRGYVDLIHQQALRYSPASGAFAPDASLATARAAHAAFTLPDGKVVVAGGYNPYSGGTAFDPVFTSSEIYDPATKKFSPGPEMNFPRRHHVATALKDNRVLITGGIQLMGAGFGASPNTEIFDPATNTFVAAERMNEGRWLHTATLLKDGRVLIVGGRNNNCSANCPVYALNSAEIYDPSTGIYTLTGSMHIARYNHTATLLQDGRVLILGGETTDDLGTGNDQVGEAEVYDPATGQFSTWTSLLLARSSHQAVELLNGRILVMGGLRASAVGTDRTEIFDPETGESHEGPLLNDFHVRATATRLSNGEVFLFAGWNGAQPGSYGETFQ